MSLRNVLARITGRRGRDGGGGRSGLGGDLADVRIAYTPDHDGQPDPGEVVWTWVPYEEDDRQGKDRPVVVIGSAGPRLAVVPVTSRSPVGRTDPKAWVAIGSGRWDGQGRPSYANVDRVLRVAPADVRREGATLARAHFDDVIAALHRRHPTQR